MNVGLPPFKRVRSILRTVGRKFFSDNGFFLSSALAFNLLLYFIPLSLLMISVLGYTILDSERAMREVESALRAFLPRSQEALAENIAAIAANRGLLGVAGFVSFLLFSTFLFGTVRTVLNHVFDVGQGRSLVHGLWIDVVMMGSTAVLLLFAVGETWFLTVVETVARRYPAWSSLVQPGFELAGKMLGTAATACLLYVLYRFAPAKTVSSRALLIASVSGTLLFQLTQWGFEWYVAIAQQNVELYGAFAGMLFLVMWLYYASAVFIVGAEIGWAYDQERAGADRSQAPV